MNIFCWDFDGTLVHSNSLWSRSLLAALNENVPNHNIEFDDIRTELKSGFTWHTPFEDYSALTGDNWWHFMNEYFLKVFIKLGLNENQAIYTTQKVREIIKRISNYELYNDTIYTLEKLKDKGKHIIISNNYPDMDEVVEKLGLLSYFEHIVVSSVIGYDKPRIEIFKYAEELFTPNDNFIMIGDNPTADIIGGNKAGMTTILVHKNYCPQADYCFETLSDIIKMFR